MRFLHFFVTASVLFRDACVAFVTVPAERLAALHGGEPVPNILGDLQATGVIGQGSTSKHSLDRLVEGVSWLKAGAGAPRLSNGSVMRVGPLGLL